MVLYRFYIATVCAILNLINQKHGIVEFNSTQQEIVKLLLENKQLSAAKLTEKICVPVEI